MAKPKQPSMLTIVKPVILVNQFLGVCPHEISGEILVFRKKSFKFMKTLFTICILIGQLVFTTFQFSKALIRGQNMVKLGFLFAAMTAPAISLLILGVTLQKREQFTLFFVKCQEFKSTVCMKGITNCPLIVRVAWKFYAFYMFLALCQAFLVCYDSLRHPSSETYPLHYTPQPSAPFIVLNCFYQFYIVLITQSACALVEVLCASISYSIVGNINKIHSQMKSVVDQMNQLPIIPPPPKILKPSSGGGDKDTKIKNFLIQMETGVYGIPYYPTSAPLLDNEKNGLNGFAEETNPTEPIMTAIKRYSYIAQKQKFLNCLFGSILALDIAWLVIHVCVLFFLQIKSIGLASTTNLENLDIPGNSTFIPEMNEIIPDPFNENEINFKSRIANRIGFFGAQSLIYLTRLMIVLISLGNVHEAARWFDSEITVNLLKIKNPRTSDLHLIQVHLLSSQSNPVAFSAGGFFIFSRATILYVFSIVSTYIVFMLQA